MGTISQKSASAESSMYLLERSTVARRGSDGRPAVVAVGGWMALSGYLCRVLSCGGRSLPGASLAFGRHALHAFGAALQPDGGFV